MKNSKSLQTTLNQRHFGNENLYRVPKKISPTHKIASVNKTRKALEVISNKTNLNNNSLINLIDKTQANNDNNSLQPETQINPQRTVYQDDISKTIVDELDIETEEEEIEDEEEREQERGNDDNEKTPEKYVEQEENSTSPETDESDPLANAQIPMSPKWNPSIREQLQNVVKTYHMSTPDPTDEDTWDVAMFNLRLLGNTEPL
ncbi:unnamed protein product [Ambrosiozyma monospora]|uniref:Unnamed protein product n=1 Tax=Ambrosiozyma monospora TaxID=43982 RepID=A0A9W7DIT8_AMBMO|nr:unnamed protein product [Ambrosiozyma monospora]